MGTQAASGIPSKSVRCGTRFGFLSLLLLLNLTINACGCRSSAGKSQRRSSHHNYFKFHVRKDQRKNVQEQTGKCSLADEGSKQLEQGVQLPLVHIHGSCSPLRPANSSWESVESQILERDRFHVQALAMRMLGNISDSAVLVDIPVNTGMNYYTGAYLTRLGFGTPRENYVMIIDSGSDITWIRCKPCNSCHFLKGPVFDPKKSSTFRNIPCQSDTCKLLRDSTALERSCIVGNDCLYTIGYADGSTTTGEYCSEVLTVATNTFHEFEFGCSHSNRGFGEASGLLGLGMSTLAFPTQTISKYGGLFSYCLPDRTVADAVGTLTFGQSAIPLAAVFTRLVNNPRSPSNYFVELSGISVGGQLLSLPSGAFTGGAGTILDSGSTITYFHDSIYDAFRDLFVEKTSDIPRAAMYSILDTCYNVSAVSRPYFPSVTLHFEDGVSVNLDGRRVVVSVDRDSTHSCLAFAGSSFDLNIIGSTQQQGFRVSYDIPNRRVAFTPQVCSFA